MKRRKFIHSASLLTTGTLASPLLLPHIAMPKAKDRLGVALVGLGYYSTDILAKSLQFTHKCSLAGIVTGTPSKAEKWQSMYKLKDQNIYDYQSFDKIADNDDIDVIYIVLPPSMHAEYVIRAAKAGKQVWCEKPMAPSVKDCQSMIEACKKNKVSLALGYRMHHEPNTQEMMRWAKSKPYGKMLDLSAAAGYRENRTDHWKQKKSMGGGVMGDMGVYPLNAVRYATGLEPISVAAKASTTRPEIYHEVEETMQFDLEFPGGIMAKCEASFGKGMNTLEVNCEKGGYTADPFQAYSGAVVRTSDGKVYDQKLPNQQAKQMDDDAESIMMKKPMLVPGEEGLKDIAVVEAIYKSASSGLRVKI